MGFFKSLKGKTQVGTDGLGGDGRPPTSLNDQHPSGTHDDLSTKDEKRRVFGTTSSSMNPFRSQPSTTHQSSAGHDFRPPAGPPPAHSQSQTGDFVAPPGPPPSRISSNPPPYHDWTVIPDTALLPPPPPLPSDYSPANNASYDAAEAAHTWCATHPPYSPSIPSPQIHDAAKSGELSLDRPSPLAKSSEIRNLGAGTWSVKTKKGQGDAIFLTNLPLYFAAAEHPLQAEREKIIYFELRVLSIRDSESGVAIGYAAKPYPQWRLPGWHRASAGVHGDDGRRFVNDSWGGRDFVNAFEVGDTVGLGMRFLPELIDNTSVTQKCLTKFFFTRNGREEGSWNVDEERDAERDEGVDGLQGELDLYPAVGVFGGVEIEVRFKREDLLYRVDRHELVG